MGSFNSKYENYYSSIVNKKHSNLGYSNYNKISQKKPKGNKVTKKLIQDLCGVLAMFIFVLACKMVTTPKTTEAYNYCKEVVNENYDYKKAIYKMKNLGTLKSVEDKVVDTIEKIKSKVTGGESIKDIINENFQLPVEGKVMYNSYNGINIKTLGNCNVAASYDGKVKECGVSKDSSKYIVIDHGNGIETKYSNLENMLVKKNDKVKKGEIIGKNKKINSNKDVHFEILFMGQNIGLEKNVEMK